jgi:hypothetical protein
LVFTVLTLTSFYGCDEDSPVEETSLSVASFNQKTNTFFSELFCKQNFTCADQNKPGSITTILGGLSNEAECKSWVADRVLIGESFGVTEADVNQGLVEYDAQKAATCVNEARVLLRTVGCNIDNALDIEACDQVFTGLQANDMACTQSEHCQSGACRIDNEMQCAMGLCVEEESEANIGESCDDRFCVDNAVCVDGETESICVAARSKAVGESCQDSAECVGAALCGPGATCADVSYQNEGEMCDLDGLAVCSQGLVCMVSIENNTFTTQCTPPAAQGGSCIAFYHCQNGLQCEGVNLEMETLGTCQPLKAAGATCETPFECQVGLDCVNEQCSTPVEDMCPLPTP